ncbi:G-type lectin S-receptor-like serine/threonine-protein kinase RLK1 [Morus notabilis]|uniref:Receptor-like serine/threonine-protein kinase n=2 Tax=Morus notabilis TaxID=981085 RepID=W9QK59_9ROSA|nr:G-type lectin S-receptor-like serine/threonine-protein kinase RLK1 [Morus notabilis]
MASAPAFLLLFIMLLCSATVQAQRKIPLGSPLTAILIKNSNNTSWESESGDFAFGFQQIEKDGFLLAIWFNKIPERTIVWSANGNNLVQEGSKVELTISGLFLIDQTGKQIWSTTKTPNTEVSYAALLDEGNLVLANQDSANLWESFNEPTDTILQTQTLTLGMILVARYSESNYSSGRFHFNLSDKGPRLYKRAFPTEVGNTAYWQSNEVSSEYQLTFNQSGFFCLEAKNGTILTVLLSSTTSSSERDFYRRVILEYDGVLRQYVYPKGDYSISRLKWSMAPSTSIPSDICSNLTENTGSGSCGFNSYCKLGDEQRPSCFCPDGYVFIDPDDKIKGCRPAFEAQSCDKDSLDGDLFDLHTVENADWPESHYEHFIPVTEEWCRKACLSDCFCDLAYFKNGDCWKKQLPLRNGRMRSNYGGKAMIKIRKDNSTSKPGGTKSKGQDQPTMLLIGFLSSSVFLNIVTLVGSLVLFRFSKKAKVIQPYEFMPDMNLRTFAYAELEKATNGFEEQLGRGAFGTVFKGVIPFGNVSLVAVKKLDNMMKESEREFKAEVSAIGRTNHKNLVQLIGFCNEGQHRLLVYEFMSKGSLAGFLFGPLRPTWHHRMQIALEIARGLFYLHEECSTQIIHCDVKPQNILLDDSYAARISDFGLAKILNTDQTRTTTGIRGTKGYVAPEWFKNMPVTVKVDVYSYGIVLLEIICCRKNFEAEVDDDTQTILTDWAYDCYASGKIEVLVNKDDEAMEDMKRVENYVMVALWCIQEDPSLRPAMKKVVRMLEGTIEVSDPPDPSSFISFL